MLQRQKLQRQTGETGDNVAFRVSPVAVNVKGMCKVSPMAYRIVSQLTSARMTTTPRCTINENEQRKEVTTELRSSVLLHNTILPSNLSTQP